MTSDSAIESRVQARRPSLGRAIQRFVDATQRLAADRTDLLKVQAGQEMREGVRGLRRSLAGTLLLGAGWALLVASLVTWLSRRAPLELVLAGVGAAHALAGGWLAQRGREEEWEE